MELVLPFATPWTVKHAPGHRHVAIGPELVVTYGPLAITAGTSPLETDLPAGARLRITKSTHHVTCDGWPMSLVDAEVVGTQGPIEARLYACYTCFAYTTVAIVRAAAVSTIDAHRDDLVAVFERGRPDWRDLPICLAQAWDVGALAAPPSDVAPSLIDARYNLAQSQYLLGEYEDALAGFTEVLRLGPSDLAVERKRIQCLYALGRIDEGATARRAFRRAWEQSRDPRETRLAEYVFDQFAVAGFDVHAIETLRPRDPACFPVLVFRAVQETSHDRPIAVEVLVETSEPARAAGTPFVIAVVAGSTYRVVGGHATLPPYPQLKAEIIPLLADAVG